MYRSVFLKILFSFSFLLTSLNVRATAETFPWGDKPIREARCLSAKHGMVLLLLEFHEALEQEIFGGRDYVVVKWIPESPKEVDFNARLRDVDGILPGFGYTLRNFNLATLLRGVPSGIVEKISASINRLADDTVVETPSFRLSGSKQGRASLIVMPFLRLLTLNDFICAFGASERLVNLVEVHLSPAFEFMAKERLVHGDLALRNVGVVLTSDGPFADTDEVFDAISEVVLYDFGGKKARILGENEAIPPSESLDYILVRIREKIKGTGGPTRSSRTFTVTIPGQMHPSPLKLWERTNVPYGSPYKVPLARRGGVESRGKKCLYAEMDRVEDDL